MRAKSEKGQTLPFLAVGGKAHPRKRTFRACQENDRVSPISDVPRRKRRRDGPIQEIRPIGLRNRFKTFIANVLGNLPASIFKQRSLTRISFEKIGKILILDRG
jgi:hypothetical protein